MSNGDGKWARWVQLGAHIGTIIAALVATSALVFGVLDYRSTSEAQREASAVRAMRDHLELSIDKLDVAAHGDRYRAESKQLPPSDYAASVESFKTTMLKAAPSGIAARSWLKIAHLRRLASYQTPTGWSL